MVEEKQPPTAPSDSLFQSTEQRIDQGQLQQGNERVEPKPADELHEDSPGPSRSGGDKNSNERTFKRGPRFWAIILAVSVTTIMSALEGTVISTALPTVIRDLGGGNLYLWAVNGYFLPNMVFQPLYAQAADIFGRRWVYITAVVLFTVGSALCGSAVNMSMFIFGRAIQGTGGAGMYVLSNLVVCDLVPLRERGAYLALILCAVTVGNGIGPFIGGIIVQSTTWRWVFYMNLPLAGVSLALLVAFLRVAHHKDSLLEKIKRIDYTGEAIFIGSVVSIIISLTYGGVTHPWSAWQTILPLVLGLVGLVGFFAYEGSRFCLEPTIPLRLFKNRTTVATCILGFLHSLLGLWIIYFLPVYFQAVLGSSPSRSGIQLFPTVLILIPFAAISGKLLQLFGRYRPLSLVGFALMVIGFGVFTLLKQNSSTAAWVLFQAIEAAGAGLALSSLLPAAQAALDEADTARITGTYSFIRSFGISFAVTVPGAIFNNKFDRLAYRISDPSVRAALLHGQAYEHATKAFIGSFQNPLRDEIIGVYQDSLKYIWQVALVISGLAFSVVFFLKEIELRKTLKTDYGMIEEDLKKADP